ncbi:IclR family transcriptional regulator [Acinetobacter courvalinii]|uniref:IclR family transcriptional regulator n=1 Tax=Acinetobacter courvalinii TaxID=280147 RepID=UPI0021CF42BD|nr:IclR family transcriptional regulator [Acinetobacter courvalinii]MCU4367389.1 IclR family transcriptional regulator [Acinetobacter courvalinii]MCU4445595.1 IclR family transcriptional regulator [Acinetobacter courvalinii]
MNSSIETDSQESDAIKNEERYLVPGLVRGLAILQAFNQQTQEMTITEIAEILDVNRSSAFRLIYTLESCGFLRKASQKTYALDSKVMELGFNSLARQSLLDLATPLMKELRDQTQLAVHLSILEGTHIVFINNIQSNGTFTSNIGLGTRWPAHATVIGQMLLADLAEAEIKERYKGFNQWDTFSELTPKNLKELLQRLHFVKTQRSMVSWGHYNHDMAACAAPIYKQSTSKMAAVLSVSCPLGSYDEQYFRNEVAEAVIQTADKISKFIY